MEATQSIEGTGPGKTLRSCVTTAKDVRQHRLRQPLGLLRRVPTCVLQTVGDAVHEAGVIRRLAAEVRLLLLVRDEEGDLLGSSPLVHVDQARVIRRDQRSVPKTDLGGSQLAIGKLQHDTAHVLVGEEVFARELEVVQGAAYIVKEGVATPACEEAIVSSLRHLRIGAH